MKLTHFRAVLIMVVVALMWSTAGVVTRQLESARSFEVTFWRSFFTALSLLVLLPAWRGRAVFTRIRQAGSALWLSGVCWGVMFTAFMLALTLTSVANVLVTLAIGPFLTALVSRLVIGQRLMPRTWGATAVAGGGIAWMYAGQANFSSQWAGITVALAVPIAAACNWTVVQRSRVHGERVDLVPAVLVGALLSSMATLPLAFPLQATMHDIGLLAMLGLFQLAIPCVLAVICAGVLKAPEVSLLALLEVIFGILLAWVGAGEVPGPNVLVGGSLVIAALVANELMGWIKKT
jgi:drug/metabolite transporter (DMT)-like permease